MCKAGWSALVVIACAVLLLGAGGCVNRPPTLNCAADPATITEGDTTTIATNASDPERKALSFEWQAAQGKLSKRNGSAVFDSSGLAPGTYSITADVRDKKNLASCTVEVIVEKRKLAPTVTCSPSQVDVNEGSSVTIRAQASDPNNDALSYSWAVDGQKVAADQASFNFGTAGRSVGAHTARVTVTDVDGMTAGCDFNVTIKRRPNPALTLTLSLDKSEVYAGELVTARADARDPDNDPLTYSWKVDGQSRSEQASTLRVNTSGFAGGSHGVEVTVKDDRGDSQSEAKSFKVTDKTIIPMDRMRLDNVAKAQLDEIAVKMQQNSQLKALITGHTDDRGSEKNNVRVGQRRADAAKKYLVEEHQVEENRIETKSAGESQPISDNSTAEGRKENRRVEVELSVQ